MGIKIFLWASIVWILPVIYFTQKNEAKFKKNIFIGTTLPEEAREDEDVLRIKDEYLKKTGIWAIIFALAVIPGFFPKGYNWLLFYWMLWLDGIIVVLQIPFVKANKALRALKKEKGWAKNPVQEEEVRVNTSDITIPKWVSPWVFVGAFLLTLAPILIDRSIWLIVLINALCSISFYFFYRFCFRSKSDMFNDDIELTKALTQIRRSYWARFWIKCAYATAVFSYSFLLLGKKNGLLLLAMAVYTVYIGAASFKQEIKIRNIQEKLTVDCGHGDYIDDDDKWLWGMFYCNKNDSHTMVNARVGMGTTVNIAKPFGKFIMIVAVACLVLTPPFPFFLDAAIDTDVEFKTSQIGVTVSCGRDEWKIKPSDIESIELVYEYPDNLSRTWGTATDKILKGNFKAKDINLIQVALNPEETPYILIKTLKGKYYLFGRGSTDRTMELYKALLGE